MTSKISCNSLGQHVRDQLRRMRSYILLFGVIYLAAGPLLYGPQMHSYSDYLTNLPLLRDLYFNYFFSYYFLAIAVGVSGGLYVTYYQHVPSQANFYHSLPITRSGLLTARLLALILVQGLLLLVITVVNIVLAVILGGAVGDGALVLNLALSAGVHYLNIMLVFLMALATTLLAGQLTATIIGQILMTAVLHGTLPLLGSALSGLISLCSSTMDTTGLLGRMMRTTLLTPVLHRQTSFNAHMSAINPALAEVEAAENFSPTLLLWPLGEMLVYVALIGICLALTYLLYQRRPLEKAGDTLVYPLLGSFIKALYIFMGAIVVGLVLDNLVDNVLISCLIGTVLAMIVVHLIAEMIYSQDADGIRRHPLSTAAGGLLALAVALSLQTGLVDLDQHLPNAASVRAAAIAYNEDNDSQLDLATEAASDPDTIARIMSAAETLRAENINYSELTHEDVVPETETITLVYDTRLGGRTTRNYNVPLDTAQALFADLLDDANISTVAWGTIATATAADLVDCSFAWGGAVYDSQLNLILMEDEHPAYEEGDTYTNVSTDLSEGAERAAALLEAVQTDLAARTSATYQSRIVGTATFSLLTSDSALGLDEVRWGLSYPVYAEDAATMALLEDWQNEGLLLDEATTLEAVFADGNYQALLYESDGNERTLLGSISTDSFLADRLAGRLVSPEQANRYGLDIDDRYFLEIYDGDLDPDSANTTASYWACYRYLAEAEIPDIINNTEG